jgi:hypothetical protein
MPTDNQINAVALSSAEEAVVNRLPITLAKGDDEKLAVDHVEDVDTKGVYEDPNSPEAILHRYPLLRDMSQLELDALNKRLRRRMSVH